MVKLPSHLIECGWCGTVYSDTKCPLCLIKEQEGLKDKILWLRQQSENLTKQIDAILAGGL
jgi:hypothetical protein